MRTLPIVVLDEGVQGLGPGPLALPCAGVLPFLRERSVHALDLAVLPGAEGPRVLVLYPQRVERGVEVAQPVGRAVVGHHALHGDTEPLVERDRPGHEGADGALALVGEQLRVGHAAVVVDGHVRHDVPEPLAEPQPRPSALWPPPSGMRATFLTSTWTSSPGRSRS